MHLTSLKFCSRHLAVLALSSAIISAASWPKQAHAESTWPVRPITLVVPGAPGGSTDIPARLLAQKLGERLGQPVIVDNKPGAGGMLGSSFVARAQPDGYTVLIGNTGSNSINYTVYKNIAYQPSNFIPLTDMISFGNVLVVPSNSSIKSLKELINAAKAAPGKLAFSSAGVGQTTHLMGELFKERTGVDVVHVPYKGSAPGTMAIVRGETQFMFDNMTASLAHIKDGKLRPLAVTRAQREPDLPAVPTMEELGMNNFTKIGWMGFFLPAKTSPVIVDQLTHHLRTVLQDPELIQRYRALGGQPGGMSREDFAKLVADDQKSWGEIILSQKLQID